MDFDEYIDYLDQIEIPIDTKAYNKTKEVHHNIKLKTFRGIQPNGVMKGFYESFCYQRPHKRHYIKPMMIMFPHSVTITLPVLHTTSKTFGDISNNGLFFIGGAWSPET